MSTNQTYCFYHSADLDGHSSAAQIVLFEKEKNNVDVILVPVNYGYDFKLLGDIQTAKIYMVDFSFPPDIMKMIRQMSKEFIWIDHHITAINDSITHGYDDVGGMRGIEKAGCEWVYEYIFGVPVPTWHPIYFLGRYDVWDHTNPDTLNFQYGCRNHDTFPNSTMDFWNYILTGTESEIFEKCKLITRDGSTILSYVEKTNFITAKSSVYELTFEGIRFICANMAGSNSKFFDSYYDPQKHDAMMMFRYYPQKNTWSISMYGNKSDIDLSVIAKKYGGGGHKGACGFSVTDISPFLNK